MDMGQTYGTATIAIDRMHLFWTLELEKNVKYLKYRGTFEMVETRLSSLVSILNNPDNNYRDAKYAHYSTSLLSAYCKHFQLYSIVPNFASPCGVPKCGRTFRNYAAFKSLSVIMKNRPVYVYQLKSCLITVVCPSKRSVVYHLYRCTMPFTANQLLRHYNYPHVWQFTMDDVRTCVLQVLLSVASAELEALLTTLQDLGVTTMDDLHFLQEQDLAAVSSQSSAEDCTKPGHGV